jgi:hypothetical protein
VRSKRAEEGFILRGRGDGGSSTLVDEDAVGNPGMAFGTLGRRRMEVVVICLVPGRIARIELDLEFEPLKLYLNPYRYPGAVAVPIPLVAGLEASPTRAIALADLMPQIETENVGSK